MLVELLHGWSYYKRKATMSESTRFQVEPIRSLAFGSIAAGYTLIGTKLAHPSHQLYIQNLTDVQLMFSFDGTSDHLTLPSNGFYLCDITTNQAPNIGLYLAKGEGIYVKRVGVPSKGAVYVTSFYGEL